MVTDPADIYVITGITKKSGGHGAHGTKPGRPLPGCRLIAIAEIEDDDERKRTQRSGIPLNTKKVAPQSRRKGLFCLFDVAEEMLHIGPGRGRIIWFGRGGSTDRSPCRKSAGITPMTRQPVNPHTDNCRTPVGAFKQFGPEIRNQNQERSSRRSPMICDMAINRVRSL